MTPTRSRRPARRLLVVGPRAAALCVYVPLSCVLFGCRDKPAATPPAATAVAEQPAPPTVRATVPSRPAPQTARATEPTRPAQAPAAVAPPSAPASPPLAVTRPDIPRHHAHIRIALLAYYGNPMGAFEDDLLRKHVDLVVPDVRFVQHIHDVAPQTPQLLYTNTSSLYGDLLLDWLTYADEHGVAREAAFYHAVKPTPFRGDSPSSLPVAWFWRVFRGGAGPADVTYLVRPKSARLLTFGDAGEAVCAGYPERFREINLDLASGAGGGWAAALEYPTAVDAGGKPTAWAALKPLADTSAGLTRTGRITFDPPGDWKAASLGGQSRLFYVRFRTTAGGAAPAARSLLGRDYVGAGGKTEGVVPLFDADADKDGDGYLNDAEYERRAPGKDARFVYETRMPCANYGQMRFAANPAAPDFRAWAVDYHTRLLGRHAHAAGLFMDNSEGIAPLPKGEVREPVASFAEDYGSLLAAVNKAVAPRWLLANTAGGGDRAAPVIRQNPVFFEEFAIRPMSHTYLQFENLAGVVARRAALTSPPPYGVLDSYPQRGDPTDPRLQIATLAYYYLLADPDSTFLTFYGGHEPGTAWNRHWTEAAAFDVGGPVEAWSRLAEGEDPSNPAMKYRVYRRRYEKALIVYKPLSFKQGDWKTLAALGDETATKHELGGTYRPLRADGALGEPISAVTLRNGEGAILIKAAP